MMTWIEKNSPISDEYQIHRNFDMIYKLEQWKDRADDEVSPMSGHGSGRSANELFVNYVNNLTTTYSITSIVDVGSGDWSYMKDVNIASYNGYDVSSIIVDTTQLFMATTTTTTITLQRYRTTTESLLLFTCPRSTKFMKLLI